MYFFKVVKWGVSKFEGGNHICTPLDGYGGTNLRLESCKIIDCLQEWWSHFLVVELHKFLLLH